MALVELAVLVTEPAELAVPAAVLRGLAPLVTVLEEPTMAAPLRQTSMSIVMSRPPGTGTLTLVRAIAPVLLPAGRPPVWRWAPRWGICPLRPDQWR